MVEACEKCVEDAFEFGQPFGEYLPDDRVVDHGVAVDEDVAEGDDLGQVWDLGGKVGIGLG